MMQTEQFVQALWQNESSMDSSANALEDVGIYISNMDVQLGSFDYFPSPTMSLENSSESSFSIPFDSTLSAHDLNGFLGSVDDVPLEDLCDWMESDHQSTPDSSSSQQSCEDDAGSRLAIDQGSPCQLPGLVLPGEEMEVDNQLSILYLLKAYGEAVEMQQTALMGEILKRLREKACPLGTPVERLAYYFLQTQDENQEDYLRQESNKNYQAAFQAFYRIFPFGRFSHFVANSMILDSIPDDAEVVHIVDFDMGEGVQWVPLIGDLGRRRHKNKNVVQLTYLSWEEQDRTKKQLLEYAQSVGVTLIVKETDMEGLVREMRSSSSRGGREWLAFNCMVGGPHMGRSRSMSHVAEFLKVAKRSIESHNKRGVITFGDGTGTGECSGFGGYFEQEMVKLKAMFESMEWHLPVELAEARIAMESMFLANCVSSVETWEESGRSVVDQIGLEGQRLSRRNVEEAKEVIREGESLYWVSTQGLNENEMVLGCMGDSLLTVSCWR